MALISDYLAAASSLDASADALAIINIGNFHSWGQNPFWVCLYFLVCFHYWVFFSFLRSSSFLWHIHFLICIYFWGCHSVQSIPKYWYWYQNTDTDTKIPIPGCNGIPILEKYQYWYQMTRFLPITDVFLFFIHRS